MADGGFEVESWPTGTRGMTTAADQNSETGLLEYGGVVVVGIPHCPAAGVLGRCATSLELVCSNAVAVRHHFKRVVFAWLQLKIYNVQ